MMRTGNKKPAMTIKTSMSTGKPSKTEDVSPHTSDANKVVTGGKTIYGMALMSAASMKAKN
jgi:hypothetical protein